MDEPFAPTPNNGPSTPAATPSDDHPTLEELCDQIAALAARIDHSRERLRAIGEEHRKMRERARREMDAARSILPLPAPVRPGENGRR